MTLLFILWFVCGLFGFVLALYGWYLRFNEITLGDIVSEFIIAIFGPMALISSIYFICIKCCNFKKVIFRKK